MMGGDNEVHNFPKGINPKGIIIAQLMFKLACYDVEVQHISQYTTGTPEFLQEGKCQSHLFLH